MPLVRIPSQTLTLIFICESIKGCLLTVCVFLFEQAVIDKEDLALPWRYAGLELVRYGGVMLQLRSDHGYVVTFTPQSNEFTITLSSSTNIGLTAGLCGNNHTDTNISCSFASVPLTSVLSSRCLWGGETQRPFFA